MTLPKKEEKIIAYTRRVEVQPAPVFLTYPQVPEIDALLENAWPTMHPYMILPPQAGTSILFGVLLRKIL